MDCQIGQDTTAHYVLAQRTLRGWVAWSRPTIFIQLWNVPTRGCVTAKRVSAIVSLDTTVLRANDRFALKIAIIAVRASLKES